MTEPLTPRQRLLKTLEEAQIKRPEPVKARGDKTVGEYYKITKPVY